MFRRLLFFVNLLATPAIAEIEKCGCDALRPETLQARECSLCREAVKQPADTKYFFLKDANPRKANRTLILPRKMMTGMQTLADLTPAERTEYWTAAIAKGKELWGGEWGLAYNGVKVRTQCHLHVHIGKLLQGVDSGPAIFVNGPGQIPLPKDGTGLWIHPVGKRLKVHITEQICETVLLR
jgi:diadenosine tetraphosphate (Ap4A) HIT family hydrolase